jgi:urease gamma subunit
MLAWTGASVFALLLGLNAASFCQPASAKDEPVGPKDAPKTSKTKVFRIQHCDPNEATSLLDSLLESVPHDPMPPQPPAPPPVGGFGGGFGFGGGQGLPAYSTALDARTRAIVVRGNDRHIQLAADFFAVIDVAKSKPRPTVKSLRAVELKHADAMSLAQTIMDLNYDAKVVAAPAGKLLLFIGTEDVMNDISLLVKELDVETPPEPKPSDLRPLVTDPAEPKKDM